MASIKQKVFSGTMWMAAVSVCQQILQFVVQIVLARLLVPHDYGVAAIAATICMFAVVFSSAGIGAAIVQRKELPDSIKDAAAVITGGMAILLGGGLFLLSGKIARWYGLSELSLLFKIVAIDIFLKVMISLYDSLMLRAMQYRSLSLRSLIGLVAQAGVSITLAKLGCGPKSLVIGYVSGSAAQLLLCLQATRYIPRSIGDWREVKGVFQFGGWVLLGRIANQAAVTLDQMIVAKFLNAASIGLLNVSKQLASILPHTIIGFSSRLAFPVFSRWQDDIKRIEVNYWRGVRLQLMIAMPICALVGLCAYQILTLLYGAKWLSGTQAMRVFSIQALIVSMEGGLTGSVINSMGKPKFGTLIMVLSLLLLPLCAYGGVQFGFVGVAWAMVMYSSFVALFNLIILGWQFQFKIFTMVKICARELLVITPMMLTGVGLLAIGFLPKSPPPILLSAEWFVLAFRLIVYGIICLSVYLVSVRFLMKEDFLFIGDGLAKLFLKRRGGNGMVVTRAKVKLEEEESCND